MKVRGIRANFYQYDASINQWRVMSSLNYPAALHERALIEGQRWTEGFPSNYRRVAFSRVDF